MGLISANQRHMRQQAQLKTEAEPLNACSSEQLTMNPDTNKESIQIATRLAGTHIAGRAVQQINNVKLAACSLFFLITVAIIL
jgi:hypothetical protein